MNSDASKNVMSQAVEWYVFLQSAEVSAEERQQHRNWMAQDKSHQEAYEAIAQEWQELDHLESWAEAELARLEPRVTPQQKPRNFLSWFTGMAACAAAVVALLVIVPLFSDPHDIHYETLKGEQRKIVLADGSRVHLNSSTSIVVNFSSEAREINLLQGEGLFDVAHERNRPFVVKVRENKIVAVGTSFNVHFNEEKINVTVVEGRIAIISANNNDAVDLKNVVDQGKVGVLLERDRQAQVNLRGDISDIQVVDAEKVTAWDRGILILDSTPLREVAEELSRYVAGTVKVAENVPDYPVTGVIKIRDQDTMLQLLSEVVPITPVRESSQLTLLYPSSNEEPLENAKE